jgi:hypothetical protein
MVRRSTTYGVLQAALIALVIVRQRSYYVCYNQVSYTLACEHALSSATRTSTILYATDRLSIDSRYKGLCHRRLCRSELVKAWLIATVRRDTTLYLPHWRGGRLIGALAQAASTVGMLDDGLDTLRAHPKNIHNRDLVPGTEFLTFTDYPRLADWTLDLNITRVCGLETLAAGDRPAASTDGVRAIVVESPGIDVAAALAHCGAAPSQVLFFSHGNPAKRLTRPSGMLAASAGEFSIERTVSAFEGLIYCGESMVAVFALLRATRVKLVVQLTQAQAQNLAIVLPWIRQAGAVLQVQ